MLQRYNHIKEGSEPKIKALNMRSLRFFFLFIEIFFVKRNKVTIQVELGKEETRGQETTCRKSEWSEVIWA